MRKVYLSIIGFSLLCRLNAWSQTKTDAVPFDKTTVSLYKPIASAPIADTGYNARKLRIDEIDLVSSYYNQTGNHSAVRGGIGDEAVTDLANGLDLNLVWLNNKLNKNTLALGFGFDYHSAASQAYVSVTGASRKTGTRVYPSIDWTTENAKSGNTFGLGAYYSGEYNYQSLGADLHFSIKTADKNGEFAAKFQGYFDHVKLIYPSELIPNTTVSSGTGGPIITSASGTVLSGGEDGGHRASIPSSPRTTLTAALSYSQMINSRLQVLVLGDVVAQQGYLSLPFHRVYFNNAKDTVEKLPSSRFKLPLGVRLNYFLGDNIILRTYYRYYLDNWGIRSNTIGLEVPYKITPFFSISPFYRYYNQSASKYFAPYQAHSPTDEFYSSNYEYSKFQSSFYGVGFRIAPPKGVFGWQGLHELEIRYGHYTQTTDLVSDVVSLSLGFK